MATAPRKYVARETKLLKEWRVKNYPENPYWRQVSLGPTPGTKYAKYYKGLRRWADLIILTDKEIIIVEAKMRPKPEGYAELELYKDLFTQTPEFKMYWDMPIRLIYLTTKYDQTIDKLCKEKDIELVIYDPAWVKKYWKDLMKR